MTNANRTNKFAGSKQKKKFTNLVAWECKVELLKKAFADERYKEIENERN